MHKKNGNDLLDTHKYNFNDLIIGKLETDNVMTRVNKEACDGSVHINFTQSSY